MPSTSTDRLFGLTTSVAVKAACRVCTSSNITLSGLQTIDGVSVAARNRVLVKSQTDATENGIYLAQSGVWVRAPDFDGSLDVVGGTIVMVTSGTINAKSFWQVAGYGDLTVGSDEINFEATSGNLSLQSALAASSGATLVVFIDSGTGAVATTVQAALRATGINVKWYGATGDGSTDDTAAIVLAVAAAKSSGRALYFPPGTYVVSSTIELTTDSYVGAFGPGPSIIGAGIGKTIFDNRVASGPLFDVDSDANHASEFKGVLGCVMQGFTVLTTTSPASSTAIRLRTTYMAHLSQIHIDGMTADGIRIPCSVGDNDGSNMACISQTRIENCAGWGIDAAGDSGFNETSFLRFQQVFIQACGTVSGDYQPSSGGMRWKGQVLTLDQCAFTLNENCALWIPGEAALGQTVDLQNTTFEHNKNRSLFCRGISAFKGRNLQFYNNNNFIATTACEFEGGSFTIRQVDIDGVVVRATADNNAYTAFKISGVNTDLNSCRVRRVVWDDFDYSGQTRFDGWQFDAVEHNCDLVAADATTLTLRPDQTLGGGNAVPLRLRGGAGGTPSTTGEWIAYQVAAAGISTSNSSLANNTRYYTYLYDNNGAAALELSTTGTTVDAATGYRVKIGDSTRLYVGSVETDGSAQFKLTACGWLDPLKLPGTQVGVHSYLWVDATGDLRVGTTLPSSDTGGTVVGTQT